MYSGEYGGESWPPFGDIVELMNELHVGDHTIASQFFLSSLVPDIREEVRDGFVHRMSSGGGMLRLIIDLRTDSVAALYAILAEWAQSAPLNARHGEAPDEPGI